MAEKVIRIEIVEYGQDVAYFEVETWGDLKYMKRQAQSVWAIFGAFTRTENRTLLYQSFVTRDGETEEELLGTYDSMYLDDFSCLKDGSVEIEEYRQQQ